MTYTAQNSTTISRLKTGDSLFLSFEGNGIPLYQGVDESGNASPSFKEPANQPVVKPVASSSRGNTVTLSNHTWTYNLSELVFNGETSDGYTKDSTGKFAMNSDGWLKIIDNLASKTNNADDTLTYTAVATVSGAEYSVTKTTTITIAQLGSNTYSMYLEADHTQLSTAQTSTTVKSILYKDGKVIDASGYFLRVFKGSDTELTISGKSFEVKRDDVNGAQVYVAKAYESSTSTTPVAVATINILDISDEFRIEMKIVSGTQVDKNNSVVVGCVLYLNGAVYTPPTDTKIYPQYDVYRVDGNWASPIRTVTNEENITITSADTDYTDDKGNEKETDVTVMATVTI
jgi:hypothetical protein